MHPRASLSCLSPSAECISLAAAKIGRQVAALHAQLGAMSRQGPRGSMAKCSRWSGIKIGKRASMAELGALHGGGHGASIALLARQHEQRRRTRRSSGRRTQINEQRRTHGSSGARSRGSATGLGRGGGVEQGQREPCLPKNLATRRRAQELGAAAARFLPRPGVAQEQGRR